MFYVFILPIIVMILVMVVERLTDGDLRMARESGEIAAENFAVMRDFYAGIGIEEQWRPMPGHSGLRIRFQRFTTDLALEIELGDRDWGGLAIQPADIDLYGDGSDLDSGTFHRFYRVDHTRRRPQLLAEKGRRLLLELYPVTFKYGRLLIGLVRFARRRHAPILLKKHLAEHLARVNRLIEILTTQGAPIDCLSLRMVTDYPIRYRVAACCQALDLCLGEDDEALPTVADLARRRDLFGEQFGIHLPEPTSSFQNEVILPLLQRIHRNEPTWAEDVVAPERLAVLVLSDEALPPATLELCLFAAVWLPEYLTREDLSGLIKAACWDHEFLIFSLVSHLVSPLQEAALSMLLEHPDFRLSVITQYFIPDLSRYELLQQVFFEAANGATKVLIVSTLCQQQYARLLDFMLAAVPHLFKSDLPNLRKSDMAEFFCGVLGEQGRVEHLPDLLACQDYCTTDTAKSAYQSAFRVLSADADLNFQGLLSEPAGQDGFLSVGQRGADLAPVADEDP